MRSLPLLRSLPPRDLSSAFARQNGVEISAARFLRDVAALAAILPDQPNLANLCQDRYRFTVGFAAALCRGQVTLLPPSDTPALLDEVLGDYPGVVCLVDAPTASARPVFPYPNVRDDAAQAREIPAFPPDQPAAILFTSGSTGKPQPHVRSWGLLVSSAISAGHEIGADRLAGGSLIGTVPHQHSYGLESLVMLALQHGLVLHAERPFFPFDIVASLAASPAPRMLVTTPVHLKLLLAEAGDLPAVDLVLSATAPLDDILACAAEEGFAAPVHEIYGCSEIGQLASRRTLHGGEWRCLEAISLRAEGGATWASGPFIAEETRLSDIIELRDSRHFRLLGRGSDLVNIAGKRSSLASLGARLVGIEGVVDGVFVIGGESDVGRLYLEAFVVTRDLGTAEILAALRLLVDPAFLPRRVHRVESLPRNELGKLTRAQMADLVARASGV